MSKDRVTGPSDFLTMAYTGNEEYHARKETLVWLSASTYVGFVGITTSWLLTHPDIWTGSLRPWAVAALAIICAAFSRFTCIQNWYKADSVRISACFHNMIRRMGTEQEATFRDISDAISLESCFCQRLCTVCKNGRAGLILIGMMIVLGVGEAILVALYPAPPLICGAI